MSLKAVRENRRGFIFSRVPIFSSDEHPLFADALSLLREVLGEPSQEAKIGSDLSIGYVISGYCDDFDPLPVGANASEYHAIFRVTTDGGVSVTFRRVIKPQ